MAASVNRFAPVVRGEGKGLVVPMAQWIDAFLLAAATARSYTLPTGINLAGGGTPILNPPPGVTVTATILRISNPLAAGVGDVVWVNPGGVATVPTADILTGLSSFPILPGEHFMFQLPVGVASISMISTTGGVVIIEGWW
jgi:hypothetical protein